MSSDSKDETPEELFSRNLNDFLDGYTDAPRGARGRPQWVQGLLPKNEKKKPIVSIQGVTKWLDGRVIPRMAHLSILCSALNANITWLLYRKGPMRVRDDPQFSKFELIWSQLTPDNRSNIVENADFLLAKQPPSEPMPGAEVRQTSKSA